MSRLEALSSHNVAYRMHDLYACMYVAPYVYVAAADSRTQLCGIESAAMQ